MTLICISTGTETRARAPICSSLWLKREKDRHEIPAGRQWDPRMRVQKASRDSPYSYTFAVFPALELLRYQSTSVEHVLLHSAGERNEGAAKIQALCDRGRIPVIRDDK